MYPYLILNINIWLFTGYEFSTSKIGFLNGNNGSVDEIEIIVGHENEETKELKTFGWKGVGGFKVKLVCMQEIIGKLMKICNIFSFVMRMKNKKSSSKISGRKGVL